MSAIQSLNEINLNHKDALFFLFNNSPLPCFIVETHSFKIKAANESAVNFYGYDLVEFNELHFNALNVEESRNKFLHKFRDKLKPHITKEIFHQRKKNGEVVNVELHSAQIIINKQPYFQILVVDITDKISKQNHLSADITQRKKIEKELKLLAHLVEETADVLMAADLDFKPVTWNKAAEKVYGLKAEQIIGRSLRDYIEIFYQYKSRDEVRKIITESGSWQGEMYFTRPNDNKAITLISTFKLLKDENNLPLGYVIAGTDITEKKEANKTLAESEARKSAILESSLDAIVTINTTDHIIEWNSAAERIFGYSRQEAVGQIMSDLIIPERFRAHHLKGIEHLLKTGEGPVLRKLVEVPALRKDGTEFPSELYISVINIEDEMLFTATLRDITERKLAEKNLKESEQRFRDVADSAPVMIWMSNEENKIIYVNKPWTDFTGLTTEMLAGRSWDSIVHSDDKQQAIEKFNTSFTRIEPITMIYRLKKETGEYRWVLDTGIPRKLNDGTFLGYIGSVVDINDQKIKEDQLRYQATILENVLDVMVTTDLNFIVKSWNRIAEKVYGYTEEEAMGKPFEELVKFQFINDERDASIEALEKNGVWKGEILYKNKQGIIQYFVHTITFVYDAAGKKIGVLFVGKDITDRRLAEENLQQSEQFYRSLIADSLDGILLLDVSGTITFVSPSILHILGYEIEEITGKNAMTYVHPDDYNLTLHSFQEEIEEIQGIKFIVVRLLCKDGSWLWCSVRGHNLLDNPYVNSIVVYFHDDTLRKKASDALIASEQRFRTLISDLQIGVILYDNSGKIIMCNKMVLEMHNNTSEQELINKDIYEVIVEAVHEDGRRFLPEERPLYHVLKYKKTVKDVVMGIRLEHNKELIWLLIHTDPILDEAGNIIHIISSLKDITERKKLEQRLLQEQISQQKALTQATIDGQEKERKEIGKELHDNIGQQLTTTKLYLDLAHSSADDAARKMITLSLKSIGGLINEVRGMSRSLMPPTLGDLGLIDSIHDMIETIIRTQPLIIKLDDAGFDEGKIAENQKLMIFRIVQEQLNNILKHAAAKNVAIKVQNNKPMLFLEIIDDGNGFDIINTRKGVGLTSIKNRAELFGGKVEIFSAAGEGCAVKVTIPHNATLS